jgi:hypothetical protein
VPSYGGERIVFSHRLQRGSQPSDHVSPEIVLIFAVCPIERPHPVAVPLESGKIARPLTWLLYIIMHVADYCNIGHWQYISYRECRSVPSGP